MVEVWSGPGRSGSLDEHPSASYFASGDGALLNSANDCIEDSRGLLAEATCTGARERIDDDDDGTPWWSGQISSLSSQDPASDPPLPLPPGLGLEVTDLVVEPDLSEAVQESVVLMSLGTQDHPYGCGEACKHVRRKTGCKEGAKCLRCHKCVWRRGMPPKVPAAHLASSEPLSVRRLGVDRAEPAYIHSGLGALLLEVPYVSSEADTRTSSAFEKQEQFMPDHMTCPRFDSFGGYPGVGVGQPWCPPVGSAWCPTIGSVGHPDSCASGCKYNSKTRGCKDGAYCSRCHLCPWRRYRVKFF